MVVDKIEARGPRVAHIQRGLAVPLHAGKASRSLLACLDDDEINDYLANAAPLKNYQHLFAEAAEETNEDVWGRYPPRARRWVYCLADQQLRGNLCHLSDCRSGWPAPCDHQRRCAQRKGIA